MSNKGKGTLGYYQHTRQSYYPTVQVHRRDGFEDVTITARCDDGGTYGEFNFFWIDFGRNGTAIELCVFTDAMWMLTDSRLNELWYWLSTIDKKDGHKAMSPEEFTMNLERVGLLDFSHNPRQLTDKTK